MMQIDYHAYTSRLLSVHPGEKISFSLITMAICLASPSAITPVAIILLMLGVTVFRGGIPGGAYLKLMTIPATFLVLGVWTVALTFSVSGLPEGYLLGFTLGGVSAAIYPRDMIIAGHLFFKSLGAVSCLYFLALTTPMVDIISILRRLKVPALFIELMTLTYRFVFVMAETAGTIYTSQSSRLGYGSLKTGYLSTGSLISSLFIRALHHSRMLYTTLSARGYNGEIRVLETRQTISIYNVITIITIDLFLAALTLFSGGGLFGGLHY